MTRAGGPIPKPKPSRARDAKARVVKTTTIGDRVAAKPPALPKGMLAETRRWWDSWKTSPQAELFTVTDWTRLLMLAKIVDAYHREPTTARMAEIRQNESKFGATPEDRLRLRWRFRDDDPDVEVVAGDAGISSSSSPAKRKRRRSDPRLRVVS